MGETTLVEQLIGGGKDFFRSGYLSEGKSLIARLEKVREFKITAAFWCYLSEPNAWRLFIASPYVEKNGTMKTYKLIQSALKKMQPTSVLTLDKISAVKPSHPLISTLKKYIGGGEVHILNAFLDGLLIEEAHIYKVR